MADEKPKDDKPKGDAKPKTEEKPAETPNYLREIAGMLFMLFVFMTIFGGVLASASSFISGLGSKSFSLEGLLGSYTRPFASVFNPIGGFATVVSDGTTVFDTPGGSKIGTQKRQAVGRVVRGPVMVGGVNYWYVDFEKDPDGWVSEKDLGYSDPKTRPLKEKEDVGTHVKTKNGQVGVYGEVGGDQVGTQSQGVYGKIVKGPVMKDGVRYWYIDFDEGVDGWVSEKDLVVVEPEEASFMTRVLMFVYKIGAWMRVILWVLIVVLVCSIAYVIYNLTQIRKNTRAKLYQVLDETTAVPTSINKSWDRVKLFVDSYNESEWRLAVIEADIMLAELLDTMNLQGDSIGEKLKGVEKSDFNTLDLAWEAHKVRNQIAHDPSFLLTQREAKRVIGLFEEVFREFSFI